jgi:regulator of replication initiation timing
MSTSEDPDDVSSITWPGFVDIMSSVIMMFIFFVLITSVALYFHTITYKSKVMASIAGLTQKSVEQQTRTIVQENQQMKKENMELREKIAEIEDKTKKADSKFAESKEQSVTLDEATDKVVLFFGGDSISLTEETNTAFADFVTKYLAKVPDKSRIYVEILASKEISNDNELFAQEIATARLMNTRNVVLRTEIPKDHITINIVPSELIDEKSNWVTIRFYQQ